jgi:hypothetical protein
LFVLSTLRGDALMTKILPSAWTKVLVGLVSALMMAAGVSGCAADARTLDPNQIEQQYGVSGAYTGSVATPSGPIHGTIVPITLADGRPAQLIIPQRQASDVRSVYLVDGDGLHPVQLNEHASRQDVIRAPAIVQRRSKPQRATTRSWEKEALIIGGSAGAGTAIGALAGGKKGAGVGAAAGGVGGLIFDLLTREKK